MLIFLFVNRILSNLIAFNWQQNFVIVYCEALLLFFHSSIYCIRGGVVLLPFFSLKNPCFTCLAAFGLMSLFSTRHTNDPNCFAFFQMLWVEYCSTSESFLTRAQRYTPGLISFTLPGSATKFGLPNLSNDCHRIAPSFEIDCLFFYSTF